LNLKHTVGVCLTKFPLVISIGVFDDNLLRDYRACKCLTVRRTYQYSIKTHNGNHTLKVFCTQL